MRLLLLKICVGAMYFIIGCLQLQVSGKFAQPKRLLEMKQENVIRPEYYSYKLLKGPEKSITENWSGQNGEWKIYVPSEVDTFPKKYYLLKSPTNIFKILHKLVSKSESLEGKQSLKLLQESRKMTNIEDRENKKVTNDGNYRPFFPNTLASINDLKKQEINNNIIGHERGIGFYNYLNKIIQHVANNETTSKPKIALHNQSKEVRDEISKIRRERDMFPPLADFKSLQNAIKAAAYFELYKDGNLSSFEHFDFHTNTHNFSTVNGASEETPRLARSNTEMENLTKKKSAISKFLLDLQDAMETAKFLTDGMFYSQVDESDEEDDLNASNSNDTLVGDEITRKIRQLSEGVDKYKINQLKKKLIEMENTLNQLTESIAKNRCNCLGKESCGLERKAREIERGNCLNYEKFSKIVKVLNSLLSHFLDSSVGDLGKTKNFDIVFKKLSDIKLKRFQSELQNLREQLSNTI